MMQAQDTFVSQLADGRQLPVHLGDLFPDDHELVARDQDPATGSGLLFAHISMPGDGLIGEG